jgi:amino acid transporter
LTVINTLGVQSGAKVQNTLTLLKIGALGLLILMGLGLPAGSWGHFTPLFSTDHSASWFQAFGTAMVAVLWAYDGWIQITYVAGEVAEPQKTLPKALVASTAMVIGLYLLINIAYLHLLAPHVMAGSERVAADAAQVATGLWGASFVALAIILSTLGANNGFILTGARISYAMARKRQFFPWAGTIHPKTKAPYAALILQGSWACILTLTGSFEQLFTYVIFASWLFYALSCGALFILRRTQPDVPRAYKVWGYPWTPLLFIGFALWLTVNTIWANPRDALIGLGIILAGIPAYFFWTRQSVSPSAR